MSEATKIESLRIQHWEETLTLRAEAVLEAEKRLGELSLRYSGQLTLFEISDVRV